MNPTSEHIERTVVEAEKGLEERSQKTSGPISNEAQEADDELKESLRTFYAALAAVQKAMEEKDRHRAVYRSLAAAQTSVVDEVFEKQREVSGNPPR